LEESLKLYRANPQFEVALKKVTAKLGYRIAAEPAWGIENDMFFVALVEGGKMLELAFFNQTDTKKMSDFILSATPQIWKGILRKDKKFISEFMTGKVTLEEGSRVALLKITPYANHFVDALTQFELQFPDEMTAEQLETYRADLSEFHKVLSE
jgi:hypothetical protein